MTESFTWEDRCVVNEALRDNMELLNFSLAHMDVCDLAEEMYVSTLVPFDPTKAKPGVDTLDRHLKHCVGNNAELAAVLTFLWYEWMEPHDVAMATTFEQQDTKKLDIITHSFTVQVKTATRGNTRDGQQGHGQLFVRESDLEGEANYLAYVDGRDRYMHVIKRLDFFDEMKELEKKPVEKWYGSTGWWIDPVPGTYRSIVMLSIPEPVAVTYTNYSTGRTVLSKRK